jgi:hypothetical protein
LLSHAALSTFGPLSDPHPSDPAVSRSPRQLGPRGINILSKLINALLWTFDSATGIQDGMDHNGASTRCLARIFARSNPLIHNPSGTDAMPACRDQKQDVKALLWCGRVL